MAAIAKPASCSVCKWAFGGLSTPPLLSPVAQSGDDEMYRTYYALDHLFEMSLFNKLFNGHRKPHADIVNSTKPPSIPILVSLLLAFGNDELGYSRHDYSLLLRSKAIR
ncbi:hypothetical protein K504DRAFT_498047 [Pleomassaria siparia CBS 279.74]|uniref:Uncharacterized protein n=1 Tax=Pleomassaria siparia CBS 279.74 TaxID=1314801 RepID=A0A6G1KKT4_9PLEO|nr:hypothetical protein K504DRAFT_498047 [Pleomassaria siparia CBS 279.74]